MIVLIKFQCTCSLMMGSIVLSPAVIADQRVFFPRTNLWPHISSRCLEEVLFNVGKQVIHGSVTNIMQYVDTIKGGGIPIDLTDEEKHVVDIVTKDTSEKKRKSLLYKGLEVDIRPTEKTLNVTDRLFFRAALFGRLSTFNFCFVRATRIHDNEDNTQNDDTQNEDSRDVDWIRSRGIHPFHFSNKITLLTP